MKSIKLPAADAKRIYSNIVKVKRKRRKPILTNLTEVVEEAYDTYKVDDLPTLAPLVLGKLQCRSLRHCFSSETPPLTAMRKQILDLAGSFCPYCLLDRPSTLDHYLPKETFPEFSVLRPNLVPACSNCNLIKGTKYKSGATRMFVHTFFDEFPEDCFPLKTDIEWIKGTPKFNFSIDTGVSCISNELVRVLENHIKSLNLTHWYSKRAGEEFSAAIDAAIGNISEEELKRQVQGKIRTSRKLLGPLSWEAALWSAVLADRKAIELLLRR